MKKIVFTALPLCLLTLSEHTTYSMHNISQESLAYMKCSLDELINHPKFIKSAVTLSNQTEHKTNTTAAQELSTSSSNDEDSYKKHEDQNKFNSAVSRLMNESFIFTDENEEVTEKETPPLTKTGLSWSLYWTSFTHRQKSDLLLYALENDMFEYDNQDHYELLDQGITECINEHENGKLIDILTHIKEKYTGKLFLQNQTSQAAYDHIQNIHQTNRQICINSFEMFTNEQQVLCTALITDLQKQYASSIDGIERISQNLHDEHNRVKNTIKNNNHSEQRILSHIRKLSLKSLDVPESPQMYLSNIESTKSNSEKRIQINIEQLNKCNLTILAALDNK